MYLDSSLGFPAAYSYFPASDPFGKSAEGEFQAERIAIMSHTGLLRKVFLVGIVFVLLMSQAGHVAAGDDLWTSHGPVRATINALAIDPLTPRTLYTGTEGEGVFKSIDGGETWTRVNNGLTDLYIRALAIHPSNPSILYAGTYEHGIFKSLDGGGHWTSANVNAGLTCPYIYSLVINPSTPAILYAGTLCGVFKSTDDGLNWIPVNNGLPEILIYALAMDPLDPKNLYAGTDQDGIYKTVDGGNTWGPVNTGIPAYSRIHSLAINPASPATLYAGISVGGSGIYKTTNGGGNWEPANAGLPTYGNTVVSLTIDPVSPSIVYTGTDRKGVYKSTDNGLSWNEFNTGLTTVNVQVIAINPVTPSTLYMGAVWDGVFKSTNSGAFWQETNTGLPLATITSIAIDPQTPARMYAGTLGTIYVSTDKGETWSGITGQLGYSWVNSLAINPVMPTNMYAGIGNTIQVTDDGGQIWGIYLQMFNGDVRALVIDPLTPTTVYAGVSQDGVYKKMGNGGWVPINAGLENTNVYALAIDPITPATLYAGTFGGVFKSENGGASWSEVNSGLENPYILALIIDPKTPQTLYTGTGAGVFKSTNGGLSWYAAGLPEMRVEAITIDPTSSATLYAGTTTAGVFKSIDGGMTWRPFSSGLVQPSVHELAINPLEPRTLYAGTEGAGMAEYTFPGPPNVNVAIGGDMSDSFYVAGKDSKRQSYSGVNHGPVKILNTDGLHTIASQRVIYGGVSYSEMMGLPAEQVAREYWFPYYNNTAMNSQLRISNVENISTIITVYLGTQQIDSYTLGGGEAVRKNYADRNGGPLRVTSSSADILATIRVLYGGRSNSELMGFPAKLLTREYIFPYYNNTAMDSQLRVSNVGGADTKITVYLGKDKIDEYSLAAGGATRKNYTGRNSGPLRVTSSDSDILTTIRVLYNSNSYSELMGFPTDQLGQEYWYPVYDNANLDSQLRVSNVGTDVTTISVYAGGKQIDSYSLAVGAATRKNYPRNTGPLQVVSSSQPILTTIRMLYAGTSYCEMTGLPDSQLSTQYFFPWYNNYAMDSELRLAVP
jgi:photosystem II stability/assembly factor-like uncharacterized protein